MKKIVRLSLIIFLSTQLGYAQDTPTTPQLTEGAAATAIRQSNWFLGTNLGNLGYNFDTETFTISVRPRAGYFVSDNAVLGSEIQLSLIAYQGGETFSYGFTPFARYYLPEGASAAGRFFAEVVLGFAGSSLKDANGDSSFSGLFGLRGGYAHFIARNVAVEGSFGYTFSDADVGVGAAETGLSLAFGFGIYLPSKGGE